MAYTTLFEVPESEKTYLGRVIKSAFQQLIVVVILFLILIIWIAIEGKSVDTDVFNALVYFFLFAFVVIFILETFTINKYILSVKYEENDITIEYANFNTVKTYSGKMSDFEIKRGYSFIRKEIYLKIKPLKENVVIYQFQELSWDYSKIDSLYKLMKPSAIPKLSS